MEKKREKRNRRRRNERGTMRSQCPTSLVATGSIISLFFWRFFVSTGLFFFFVRLIILFFLLFLFYSNGTTNDGEVDDGIDVDKQIRQRRLVRLYQADIEDNGSRRFFNFYLRTCLRTSNFTIYTIAIREQTHRVHRERSGVIS